MSLIGMDSLYYAKITEAEDGIETYGDPKPLGKAISASLNIEFAENTLFADNGAYRIVKRFKSGKFTLVIAELKKSVASDLFGAVVDRNGVLTITSDDVVEPVAIGFRALRDDEKLRYTWLYKIKFAVPAFNFQTQGDSISFATPSLEGIVMRRNKQDSRGRHPIMTDVDEDDPGAAEKISTWFTTVYEPEFGAA